MYETCNAFEVGVGEALLSQPTAQSKLRDSPTANLTVRQYIYMAGVEPL
jgi:hypothetical protein